MFLLFKFSMACLYIGEVVFFAFIGIKEGPTQGVVALLLIGITLAWHVMVNINIAASTTKRCNTTIATTNNTSSSIFWGSVDNCMA